MYLGIQICEVFDRISESSLEFMVGDFDAFFESRRVGESLEVLHLLQCAPFLERLLRHFQQPALRIAAEVHVLGGSIDE